MEVFNDVPSLPLLLIVLQKIVYHKTANKTQENSLRLVRFKLVDVSLLQPQKN